MSSEILPAAAYLVQPWKNGRGETREIVREGGDAFSFRISMATIDGPGAFSSFPGYDRTLLLLEGGPVTLDVDNHTHTLGLLEPFNFDGSANTQAIPPTARSTDLNVFCKRGARTARVQILKLSPGEERLLANQRHYLFSVNGNLETPAGVLGPRDTLRTDNAQKITARAEARAVLIECD